MKTAMYYCTGTGNSLWASRTCADTLGGADVEPMVRGDRIRGYDALGLVFPVHVWGLPHRVIRFLDRLDGNSADYLFAIAVNAGQVAGTLLQLEKEMKHRNLKLSSGWELTMPSNYIPWGGPGPEDEWKARIAEAETKLAAIAGEIGNKTPRPVEKGPLWQNILLSALIHTVGKKYIPKMDEKFFADEKCTSCGVCVDVCPARNIELREGKPVWLHRCEQCLACIQWCPFEAIQHGPKTAGYDRYHNPQVTREDILSFARAAKNKEQNE